MVSKPRATDPLYANNLMQLSLFTKKLRLEWEEMLEPWASQSYSGQSVTLWKAIQFFQGILGGG